MTKSQKPVLTYSISGQLITSYHIFELQRKL